MKRLIPVLNYSTFYVGHDPPNNPLNMLEGYDLEIVILTLVGIRNSLDKNKGQHARDGAIESIISGLPQERAKRLKYFMHSKHRFALVNLAVIDKILVDVFPKLQDGKITREFHDGQFEQRLLDVLLSYNELFYYNDVEEKLEIGYKLIWTLVMMQGVSRVSKVDFARTGIIKHMLMLDYLRRSLGENFITLQKSLRAKAGLPDIYYFLSWFKHIFLFLESPEGREAYLPRLDINDPMFHCLQPMDLVINSTVAAGEKFDIGMILSRPFFETSSGAVFILDHSNFSFLMERAFMFLLYFKSDFSKLKKIKNINGLYAIFGKEYYEQFLMGTLLKQLQKTNVRVIATDDQCLADFTLIMDETDIFVIEIKSAAQNYRIFAAQDVEELRTHIDEHYVNGAGTPQLERYLKYIPDDKNKLLKIKNPSGKLNIYPLYAQTPRQLLMA